jgi:hypothetical protein
MDWTHRARSAVSRFGAAFFEHLPVWCAFFSGIYVNFAAMIFFNPSREAWTWIGAFPAALVMFYFACHYRARGWPRGSALKLVGLGALQAALFLVVRSLAQPAPFAQNAAAWEEVFRNLRFPPPAGTAIEWYAGRNTIVLINEIVSLAWAGLIALHVFVHGKRGGLARFYGLALLYGVLLESGGMIMGFFFEYDFHLRLPLFEAPLAPMLSWAGVFYSCAWVWNRALDAFLSARRRHWLWGAAAMGVLGLLFDAAIDPLATSLTIWTWNSRLRAGPGFLGVPLLNYVSWFIAVWTFGAFYLGLTRAGAGSRFFGRRRAASLALFAPVMVIVTNLGVLAAVLLLEGWDSPALEVVRDAADGLLGILGPASAPF